jgi:hypothetical protein
MSKDRSLDDFLGSDETEERAASDETTNPERDESDEAVDTADAGDGVTPATPTYRFAPDGAVCDACDATVQRRWHDGGQFVCADCKEW